MLRRFLFILLLVPIFQANCEIQKVTVRWDSASCREYCHVKLRQYFEEMPGVERVFMNQSSADLIWKPNYKFDFLTLDYTIRKMGLSMRYTPARIIVRGTISSEGDRMYMTSIGDRTRFQLLSPAVFSPTKYIIPYNIATHQLREEARITLRDAEGLRQVVTIEGFLFEPQYPPLKLDIEKIEVHELE